MLQQDKITPILLIKSTVEDAKRDSAVPLSLFGLTSITSAAETGLFQP
jgi:hypothetical protein